MDKSVTARMIVQVKRKPSELFAVGSSRLFRCLCLFIRTGRLAFTFTVIRSNDRTLRKLVVVTHSVQNVEIICC